MQVDGKSKTVFNLWDTNGRRGDVINALHIYLDILANNETIKEEGWGAFPDSLGEYAFYKAAIDASPEVFKDHPKFDGFLDKYKDEIKLFLQGSKGPLVNAITDYDRSLLDTYIEARARHYVNCLKKHGFASQDWRITPAGKTFLEGRIKRDSLEDSLPLSDSNIVLLRQLLKLRVYSKDTVDGFKLYFSPFKLALSVLLSRGDIVASDFLAFIQCNSPYRPFNVQEGMAEFFEKRDLTRFMKPIECPFFFSNKLSKEEFERSFWNAKSTGAIRTYWKFYEKLYAFVQQKDEAAFRELLSILFDTKSKAMLEKAFGYGTRIFDYGEPGINVSLEFFLSINNGHDLLAANNLNKALYYRFEKSKFMDGVREYADTTKRMFDACGLIGFDKGIATLSFRTLLESIFDKNELMSGVFGKSTTEQFLQYEVGSPTEPSFMGQNSSLTQIMGYDESRVIKIVTSIEQKFGTSLSKVKTIVRKKTNDDFVAHIEAKYPVEKVIELLRMFPGRTQDNAIKAYVNQEASVPTIYEFISAIAWYYISEKSFDLYDSLNLTLNADFEPVLHAGGGDGDVVIKEASRVVMLEVTLMDASSQGRGELEPVRRHSVNLKAKYMPEGLETFTFFIASELSENTAYEWRFLFPASVMATISSVRVNNVLIMSFTDSEICSFLEKHISADTIIERTKEKFAGSEIPVTWREDVVASILS